MNYYNQIKEELINNEIYKKAKDYSKNRSDLDTYYNIGKLLVEAQGGEEKSEYGNRLIKEYSEKLTRELGKGYSVRNLNNMRSYYLKFKEDSILHALRAKLYWNHYKELLTIKDLNKISYYIKISIDQNLSYRQLHEKIKNNEYERLSQETKKKLIIEEETKVSDFIKNPILIKNSYNYTKITEKNIKAINLRRYRKFYERIR